MSKVIDELLIRSNGIFTAGQAALCGVSKTSLSAYAGRGVIRRVAQGIYAAPDRVIDDMYLLRLRTGKGVFSHDTALFLNGLSDRTPFRHCLTLPDTQTLARGIRDEVNCYYVRPELYSLGIIERKTTFGNTVLCYDPERTICDLFCSRRRTDEETLIACIKNYAAYQGKDLHRLAEYAGRLRVSGLIRPYLEVLL